METRVALIGIVVEDMNSVMELNNILHEYNSYIIGRMGLPHREKTSALSVSPLTRPKILSARCPENWECWRGFPPKPFIQSNLPPY